MFSLGILRKQQKIINLLDLFAQRASPLVFGGFLVVAAASKYLLMLRSDGGGDLLGADIPKSIMLLNGQDPYSSQPWAAPYPPFLLLVLGQIIRWTTGNPFHTQIPESTISRHIMLAGLAADLLVALLVYLTLRAKGFSGLQRLIPIGLLLFLPAISLTPYIWFHSDTFGYPLLAASLLSLEKKRPFIGMTLLGLATIFKVHPILATPLVLVWFWRRNGFRSALPSVAAAVAILAAGLILPFTIPGYSDAMLGFNLSTGFGSGTSSFTIMNLFYSILPSLFRVDLQPFTINQIWIIITAALFTMVLSVVWSRAESLGATDVVLLGLLVWLIPLRQLYTHYVVWPMIPLLARGRLRESVTVAALLELANTMAVWSWNVPPNPLPAMNNVYGFFLTSLVYAGLGTLSLLFVVRGARHGRLINPSSL
jgi:hypothetical protein